MEHMFDEENFQGVLNSGKTQRNWNLDAYGTDSDILTYGG